LKNWSRARVGVLGVARSGLALAKILQDRGAFVLLSDSRPEAQLGDYLSQARALGVEVESGGHTARLLELDALIISPGVSLYAPVVQQSLAAGIPVLGEVEVAWELCAKPMIAVTGTNGKSTTASLIERALAPRSVLAGNIGVPLVSEVTRDLSGIDWVVAEISSFQLETVHHFRPRVAVLTNITPDHLDRHPTVEEYIAAKCRIFWQQGEGDLALLNADDPEAARAAERLRSAEPMPAWPAGPPAPIPRPAVYTYSTHGPVERGCWFDGSHVVFSDGQPRRLFGWEFPNLPGEHNLSNALAAALTATLLGVPAEQIETAFRGYGNLHHRLETVGQIDEVRFIDDSKATNVSSVEAALTTYHEPIVLIAGGRDKGLDLDLLGQHIARYCAALVVIGEAAEAISQAARRHGLVHIERAGSLEAAVEAAHQLAHGMAGTGRAVVLLSPACTSFDMFLNAEDRGDRFAASVHKLQQQLAVGGPRVKESQ
jgi:UDP-N-acetylmuramoylalanine--D-glutamate ligase